MTALEYMERQVVSNKLNHDRQFARGAPEEDLENIRKKIGYYEEAVEALRKKQARLKTYPRGGRPHRRVVRVNEATGEVVLFHTGKEARESLNIPAGSFGRMLITNSLRDGYRFYYEEDWDG